MLVLRERMPYCLMRSLRHAVYVFYSFIVSVNNAICNIEDFTVATHIVVVFLHQRIFLLLTLALKIAWYPRYVEDWDSHFVEISCQIFAVLVLAVVVEANHSVDIITSHYERFGS